MKKALFDSWTEKYDSWFTTPVGQYVKKYESALLLDLLNPQPGELILDAGCGTGIFTRDVIDRQARVIGMDLSLPMLARGVQQMHGLDFSWICADICTLPFGDQSFDRVFSMTAVEFIPDADRVIGELERVTRPGGCIVVTTLNSLSPWAGRRMREAENGHSLFQDIIFRSPADMRQLIPENAVVKTAIHFQKEDSKMFIVAAALVNGLILRVVFSRRNLPEWVIDGTAPPAIRLAAWFSLLSWSIALILGRLIGYVH